jgi:hypothetical protein
LPDKHNLKHINLNYLYINYYKQIAVDFEKDLPFTANHKSSKLNYLLYNNYNYIVDYLLVTLSATAIKDLSKHIVNVFELCSTNNAKQFILQPKWFKISRDSETMTASSSGLSDTLLNENFSRFIIATKRLLIAPYSWIPKQQSTTVSNIIDDQYQFDPTNNINLDPPSFASQSDNQQDSWNNLQFDLTDIEFE